MKRTKLKKNNLMKFAVVLLCFMLVSVTAVSVNIFASEVGQGDQHDDDEKGTGEGFTDDDEKGGYNNHITVDYNFYGNVNTPGGTVDLSGTSIFHGETSMGMIAFDSFSPKEYIGDKIYDFSGSSSALHDRLASDTGLGRSSDWGNGNITVGNQGLYASIIITIGLTDSGSMIGDYRCGSSLRLGYEMINGQMRPTPDLAAILNANPPRLVNKNGVLMIGEFALKRYAQKISNVFFYDLNGHDDEDDDPPDDPHDDPHDDDDDDDEKFDKYVSFNPASNNWTNDPYYVFGELKMPAHATIKGNNISLTLHNCTCHDYCDKVHTHHFTPCTNKWDSGNCQGHIRQVTDYTKPIYEDDLSKPIYKEVWPTYIDPNDGVEKRDPYARGTKKVLAGYEQKLVGYGTKPEYYTCDYDRTCSSACSNGHWDKDAVKNCDVKPGCPIKLTCKAYNHNHKNKGSIPWDYGSGSGAIVNIVARTCSGGPITDMSPTQVRFTINSDGTHTAYVKFAISPYHGYQKSTGYTESTLPRPVDQNHQNWIIPSVPGPVKTAEKSSGPYKFDSTNPSLTVKTSGYKEAKTKTYSSNATEAMGSWTGSSIEFTITASDSLSGIGSGSNVTIESKGDNYLESPGTFKHLSQNKSLASGSCSFSLTKSGIYTIKIHVEDKANQGGSCSYVSGRGSDDGNANSFDVTYNVRIDRIAPKVKYAYPKSKVLLNSKQNRYEAAESDKPFFLLYASDKDGAKELYSGLNASKSRYLVSTKIENQTYVQQHGKKFDGEKWVKAPIDESVMEYGGNVYLLIYAVDNCGNATFTTTTVATPDEFEEKKVPFNGEQVDAYVGPKTSDTVADSDIRHIHVGNIFIDRADLHYEPDPDTKKGPLEITRVYDVKWGGKGKDVISFSNRASSDEFAAYRNKVNDMIGLGYRVNLAYHLVGYGVDEGDTTTINFGIYGKKGNDYVPLDVYFLNDDKVTYSKATNALKSINFTRTSAALPKESTLTEEAENNMITNTAEWYESSKDKVVVYFNVSIPATAIFKYKDTDTKYTGSEVAIKMSATSKKWMNGGSLPYKLLDDSLVPWNPVGTNNEFYGSSKVVTTNNGSGATTKGLVFWYDADNTAITDIEGHKSK